MRHTVHLQADASSGLPLPHQIPAAEEPEAPVNILVVDDYPENLLAMEAILQPLGLNIVTASSGEAALHCLLHQEFSVILLDVQMPGMDGFETAALIRGREKSHYTPILFLTAIHRSELDVARGYELGGVDYLFKPIVPEFVRAKVQVFVELYRKTEQIKRQARLQHAIMAYEEGFRAARHIQQALFPKQSPSIPGYDIAGVCYPAEATGGDFFDFIPMGDGCLSIAIGDVSGHGFGPALLMASTHAALRALALTHNGIGQILKLANRALTPDFDDYFVTLILARLEPGTRRLTYANAGHPAAYVLGANGEERVVLDRRSLVLAWMEDQTFAEMDVDLEPGDLVLFVTDGVFEAGLPGRDPYGMERALDTVRLHRTKSAKEIVEALYQSVRNFAPNKMLDDITAVVIKVLP